MKNKRVQCLLLLSTAMLLASCGGTSSNSGADSSQPAGATSASADVTAPIITGVKQKVSCEAGQSLDLLKDVAAVDETDGNLTSKIKVSIIPERPIVNGVVEFGKDDEGLYDVTYEVTDAAGNTAREFTEVTVTEALAPKTLVKEFAFSRDLEGWSPEIVDGTEVVGTHGIDHGKYVYDITQSDGVDWHIKHAYYNYPVQAGHNYEITAKLSSTVAGTVRFGGVDKQIVVGDNELTMAISAAVDGGRNIELQLGLLEGPFKVAIESIQINDIKRAIDEEATVDVGLTDEVKDITAENEWAFNKEWHCEYAADAGMGNIVKTETSATVTSTTEPRESWRGKFLVQSKTTLQAGKKYHYSITYTSSADISGLEFGCGFWDGDFKTYDERYDVSLAAGVSQTFEFDIIADKAIDNPMVCLKMGNLQNGASITASNFSIVQVEMLNMTAEGNAVAWSENAGRNQLLNTAKNSVTTKLTGAPESPYQASTDIKMNAGLAKEASYRISFDLKSTLDVGKVAVMMGDLDQWDPNQLFETGESINLEANKTLTFNAIVTPGRKFNGMKMRVKYGEAPDGAEITVSNLKIELVEFVKADGVNILAEGWGFNHDEHTSRGSGDYTPTVEAAANQAVFTATNTGSTWQAKAVVESRTELKKGKKYHIALDVLASAKINNVEFGAGYEDGDFKQIGHNYDVTLEAGVTAKIEYFTSTLDSDFTDIWGIAVFFGGAAAGTTLTLSNLVVEEMPNAAEQETKVYNFLPDGFSAYANENAGAKCDLYVEGGELVYDIIALSHDVDWYNKLTISDIILDGGAKYYFEIVAKSSVALNASLILNKVGGEYDPRATQAVQFGTDYATITLETDVMTAPLKFELLLQDLHQNTEVDSAKITFQSIKLYSRAVVE